MALTAQDIFNTVVEHFKTQKFAAIKDSVCRYRTVVDGSVRKCAIGVFISDDEYKPSFENFTVGNLLETKKIINPSLETNQKLAKELQLAHDGYHDPFSRSLLVADTARKLRSIAKEFELDASKVDW